MRWSFSQWDTYNSCPAKWKYKYVDKLPDMPTGPAAERGTLIHSTVEAYIETCGATPLHEAVKPKYVGIFENYMLKAANAEVGLEKKIAFDYMWFPVEPGSPKAWAVMIFDAVAVLPTGEIRIGEWKSGKPKVTHPDQLDLYMLGSLLHWKDAPRVTATTHYLEATAPCSEQRMERLGIPLWQDIWRGRVEVMERDKTCAPHPGLGCNWCGYSKRRGGPCGFGG
jgi:hypothetical protein